MKFQKFNSGENMENKYTKLLTFPVKVLGGTVVAAYLLAPNTIQDAREHFAKQTRATYVNWQESVREKNIANRESRREPPSHAIPQEVLEGYIQAAAQGYPENPDLQYLVNKQ